VLEQVRVTVSGVLQASKGGSGHQSGSLYASRECKKSRMSWRGW